MTDTPAPASSVPAAQTSVEKPATAPATPVTVAAPVQAPNTNAPAQPAPAAPVVPVAAAVVAPVAPNPTVTPPTTQSPVAQPSPGPAPVVAKEVDEEEEEVKPDELMMLKNRATLMGITFSNNIGLDALKQKIAEKIAGETKQEEPEETATEDEPVDERSPAELAKKAPTLRQRLLQDNMRLIRIRITCLDPKKKDLPGEIFTVANRYIGTVRKFVPYGEVTEGGYHVPYVIFKMLKKRKFLNIRTRKGPNGRDIVEANYVPEFAIEELAPLTPVELERLARAQIAAGSVEAGNN